MTLPVFPIDPETHPAFSFKRKPTYATIMKTAPQGREVGAYQQAVPLWEFELRWEILRDGTQNIVPDNTGVADFEELRRISELYLACFGQYGEFYFDDHTDNSREQQEIGVGDADTTSFLLIRTITGDNGLEFSEPVGGANTNYDIDVYVDGTLVDPAIWDLSADLRSIVFASAPAYGLAISVTFHYYYRCRFISDEQEFEEFMYNRWSVSSLKFRSVNLLAFVDDFNPLNPLHPYPPPLQPTCLTDFQWAEVVALDQSMNLGWQTDIYGNVYINGTDGSDMLIYNSSGDLISSISGADLAGWIDTWFGSPIVGGADSNPPYFTPILGGEYIFAYMRAQYEFNNARWFVILEPSSDGDPTVLGAVFIDNFNGPPLTLFTFLGIANEQTADDPILFRGNYTLGGDDTAIVVVPSINDIINGTYAANGYDGMGPCRLPNVLLAPIATTDFSQFMFASPGSSDLNLNSGFLLPDPDGGTNVYFYMNRRYVTDQTLNVEVTNVIQPAYPNGCITKIALGVLNFEALAPTGGSTTANYTIDNDNWQESDASAAIPFLDEYTYISNGNSGGKDAYSMRPGALIQRNDGKYWIIFYMAGIDDANANSVDREMWDRIRLFEYDPSTEVAIQIFETECIVNNNTDMGLTGNVNGDVYQNINLSSSGQVQTLSINGFRYGPANSITIYLDNFLSFNHN